MRARHGSPPPPAGFERSWRAPFSCRKVLTNEPEDVALSRGWIAEQQVIPLCDDDVSAPSAQAAEHDSMSEEFSARDAGHHVSCPILLGWHWPNPNPRPIGEGWLHAAAFHVCLEDATRAAQQVPKGLRFGAPPRGFNFDGSHSRW